MLLDAGGYVDVRAESTSSDIYGSSTRGLSHFQGMLLQTSSAFQATRSAPQNNIGTGTVLGFDQVMLNLGGAYNSAQSRFVAP